MPEKMTLGLITFIVGGILGAYIAPLWPVFFWLILVSVNFILYAFLGIKKERTREKKDWIYLCQKSLTLVLPWAFFVFDTHIMPRGFILSYGCVFFLIIQEILECLQRVNELFGSFSTLEYLLNKLEK